jgi:hypothetical protein
MNRTLRTLLVGVALATSVGILAGPASADPAPLPGPTTLLPFDQRPDPALFVGRASGNTPGKALQAAFELAQLHATNAGYWDCDWYGDPEWENPPGNYPNRVAVTYLCHPNPHV